MQSSLGRLFLMVVSGIVLVALTAWLLDTKSDSFSVFAVNDGAIVPVLERLGIFVALALFVERTTEVYVSVFLEPNQPKTPSALPGPGDVMGKAATKLRATIFSLILGTLMGLAGVSILGAMMAPDYTMKIPMRLVDILLVGALLAGGADPIHQIMETISQSAKAMKERAEAGRETQAAEVVAAEVAAAEAKAAAAEATAKEAAKAAEAAVAEAAREPKTTAKTQLAEAAKALAAEAAKAAVTAKAAAVAKKFGP
ncbi:hypothetical protein VSX64_03255 [Aurantimonas sp. C2-6-R+9]|uniref:hypothetical protein n=1 Tax=unclassified Aurantimonas TaxID=2638230 RepID=UPI002E1765BE|nr:MULTISPECIES: hypothetical protein [unclassified Aurantimonas]MEC5291872.1 hypothetical protein [Aurantimonas sp. C2-3-R2]MEC5379908.1 hypothetical protein [Aurantimonas sp. C2-6-R+9]MEC5412958.1 hypothetical protein [Aurantimonas sp. C2-4-R8]